MAKVRVFTSFDFDHDEDLRNLLVGQSKNPDSPFEMASPSIPDAPALDGLRVSFYRPLSTAV